MRLSDTTAVVDRRTGIVLAVDRMGDFVLRHREDFIDLDDAVSALQVAFGAESAVIHDALVSFESALDTTDAPSPADPFTDWLATAPRTDRRRAGDSTGQSWTVDALGRGVRVTVCDGDLCSVLAPVMESFHGASGADLEIVTWVEDGLMFAVLGDKILFERAALEHGVNQIVTWITAAAMTAPGEHLAVHAGCVVHGGRGILLVAPSNNGKSSTVVELMRRGAVYLTDEAVALEVGAMQATGFARPIGLEGPVRAHHPELRPQWWPVASTYPRWPVVPQLLGDVRSETELHGIVFLALDGDMPCCEITPLERLVAVARLCRACFNPALLSPDLVAALHGGLGNVDAVELRHPGAAAAAEAISGWIGGL